MTWSTRGGGRLLRGLGWVIVGLSLAFLAGQLWRAGPVALMAENWRALTLAVALGTPVYAAAGVLLAEAWRQLLGGARAGPLLDHLVVHGRTQIAKYLPGNCFHFAGRQWLGRDLGHGQAELAVASIAETLLLIGVALCLALPLVGRGPLPSWLPVALGWTLAASGVVGLVWWWIRPPGRSLPERLVSCRRRTAARLGKAVLLHLAFFAACGSIVWTLAHAIAAPPSSALDLARAIGAFALAWVAGVIVPGAAAGIGVREAVLTLTLESWLGVETSTLLALTLRVVTSLGDALLFCACWVLPSPARFRRATVAPCSFEQLTINK